jgi:hypothetical protein
MKKLLLSLSIIFASICSYGQNWQCLQPGVDRYFEGNYLKGMRIDSVRVVNNETILYPFRSPRGPYMSAGWGIFLDTNGGSWLGKEVIVRQDGSTLFDTYWGDTVVIQSSATMGSSWVFYNDTSGRHYLATVTSIDTMTLLGALDSVKTITIGAYSGQNINTSDVMHNKTIVLSKDHGLVKTFSLYLFPFHPPHLQNISSGYDYLMDQIDVKWGNVQSYELTSFHHLSYEEIYDFSVGDVFEYHGYAGFSEYWKADTVATKTLVGPGIYHYTVNGGFRMFNPATNPPSTTYNFYSGLFAGPQYVIDTALMPEQWFAGRFVKFSLSDTSHCIKSPVYGSASSFINAAGELNVFEPCGHEEIFKAGFGRIYLAHCEDPVSGSPGNVVEDLIYSKKNGVPCGIFKPILGVDNLLVRQNGIKVFPVPANDMLHIESEDAFSYVITDITGNVIEKGEGRDKVSIAVSSFVTGMYLVYAGNDHQGSREVHKVMVQH